MDGSRSLKPPPYMKRLPKILVLSFISGMALEWSLINSGFYNIVSVGKARENAIEETNDERFWAGVYSRRARKQAASCIQEENSNE